MFTPTNLVYWALGALLLVVLGAGYGIMRMPEGDANIETRKIRFAAATFTGIMMVFVFIASLYFADDKPAAAAAATSSCCCCPHEGAGKEIFDKGVSAMFTLAGTILGYLFGSSRGPSGPDVRT